MPVAYDNLDSNPTPQAGAAPLPSYPSAWTGDDVFSRAVARGPGGTATYSPDASAAVSSPASGGGSAPSLAPTKEQFDAWIPTTPEYKQAMENVQLWNQQQQGAQAFDANWADKFYQQNLSQIGSGDALAAERDALNRQQGQQSLSSRQREIALSKEKAERDFAQQRKYITEALYSRGNAGGQLGLETGNLQFGYDQFLQGQGLNAENAQFAYDTLLREIDLQGKGRQLENTTARSNLDLQHQYTVAQAAEAKKNLALAVAQKNGEALLAVQSQLTQLWFDQSSGMYIGPGGQQVTVEQAQASLPGASQPAITQTSQYNQATDLAARRFGGY